MCESCFSVGMCLSGSILASASESRTYAPETAFNSKLIVKGYHQFVRHDDENTCVRLCVMSALCSATIPPWLFYPGQEASAILSSHILIRNLPHNRVRVAMRCGRRLVLTKRVESLNMT